MMILPCAVILLHLLIARTEVNAGLNDTDSDISDIDVRYSLWPSIYHGEDQSKTLKLKAQSKSVSHPGLLTIQGSSIQNVQSSGQHTQPDEAHLKGPGDPRVKWFSVVLGGLFLLAIAYYFIIYRNKSKNNDAKRPTKRNHFRYGVLTSEDKKRNTELSRVPLTMESDEDEEQDFEVFDIRQRKISLPIDLRQNDEDIVFNDTRSLGLENLLVNIEDMNSDKLMIGKGV